MLIMLIIMSWTLSAMFMFLNHPLSFGFILLLQTILISISAGILSLDYWFSYILFLIMIGGMLVLFIYMTSVASNEKFKFSTNLLTFFIISLTIMMMMIFMTDNYFSMMDSLNEDLISQSNFNINLSLSKYFNWPCMMIMTTLMIYLLITLIAVVKITQMNKGPLRQTSKM